MNNFAHLKKDSPFYPVFKGGLAPIKNILVPDQGNMLGGGGVQDFYRLDPSKCSCEQLDKIAQMVASQCGGTRDEVLADIKQRGFIPIRSKHVDAVSTDSLAFL